MDYSLESKRNEATDTLDSPDGIFILADQSGHFIQNNQLDLVLAAIQNVVDKSKNSSE